eukprot:TRINITY_DN11227_c0_g1_i1.p1 TRINITY_DN11227_c0_g1~~TRINITY_DN11227_c0_g1_i1.p1  ORF type:complete len:259 (+),score=64.02 TRINITY_DN11227_c0_g1_i1:117-893(+)
MFAKAAYSLPSQRSHNANFHRRSLIQHSSRIPSRDYGSNIMANELKKGDFVVRKGKLFKVRDFVHVTPGRRMAFMQVDFEDFVKGGKVTEKLRAEEGVEVVTVDFGRYKLDTFNKTKGLYHFLNTESTEEIDVPVDFVGPLYAAYLKPGSKVFLRSYDEKPVHISLPDQILKVMSSETESTTNRSVKVDNGRVIKVPLHVKVGDRIKVRLPEEEFISKANEEEEDSDQDSSSDDDNSDNEEDLSDFSDSDSSDSDKKK